MIIDASVAFKWLIAEPGSEEARAWIERGELRAPHLMLSEVGNGLQKRIRSGELRPEGAGDRLALLPSLIDLLDERDSMARALEIAVVLSHSIYDCVYLALAEAKDDQLLTADTKFLAKVAQTQFAERVVALH